MQVDSEFVMYVSNRVDGTNMKVWRNLPLMEKAERDRQTGLGRKKNGERYVFYAVFFSQTNEIFAVYFRDAEGKARVYFRDKVWAGADPLGLGVGRDQYFPEPRIPRKAEFIFVPVGQKLLLRSEFDEGEVKTYALGSLTDTLLNLLGTSDLPVKP